MSEKAKKFEIFISYRRSGGYDAAKLIYDRLRLDGYSVSFDIETLEKGNFDKELEQRVNNCKDFLLILSHGIFDRFSDHECDPKDDWVRQEIICALKSNKNIVPITLGDFIYPKTLPDEVKEITRKNAIDLNPKHFEAAYERMKQAFLVSKPHWTSKRKKEIIFFIFAMLFVLSTSLYFAISDSNKKKLELQKAKIATDSIRLAKEQEIARMEDLIKSVREQAMARIADSIRNDRERETAHAVNPVRNIKPVAALNSSENTATQKPPKKVLHWGGSNDNIGRAIFEKIATAGIEKTKCSGSGLIIKNNSAGCKTVNALGQFVCSFSPKFTIINCEGKQITIIETGMSFKSEPQRSESRAKEELAKELGKADFNDLVSAIKDFR